MQTFLPYADFEKSAQALDRLRLGKQRLETLQILKSLRGVSKSWLNHPAVLMWKGKEAALQSYGIIMCEEWVRRGYEDKTKLDLLGLRIPIASTEWELHSATPKMPSWLGDERVHANHRARLLQKAIIAVDVARMDLEFKEKTKYQRWIKKAERDLETAREVYKWYLEQNWKEKPVTENYWPVKGGAENVRY